MRRHLVLFLAAILLLGLTPAARAGIGDGLGTPGQLVDDGPLAPQPICQTEGGINGQKQAEPGSELRVGTYNVLHTQDKDGNPTAKQRVGMLADAIERSGADALGLQEVAKSANLRSMDTDGDDGMTGLVVELLAQDLALWSGNDWHWCWFASNAHVPYEPEPTAGGGGGPLTEIAVLAAGQQTGNGEEFREGVALLSRYPIVSPSVKRLSLRMHEAAFCDEIDPVGCQFAVVFDSRVIMHGVIDGPLGPVDLYTTHIANGVTDQSDDTKARHIQEGLDHIAATEKPNTPTFYVGDYNTERDAEPSSAHTVRYSSVIDAGYIDTYVAAALRDPGDPEGTSSQDVVGPGLTVKRTIDFVFARNLIRCQVTFGDIIGDVPADRTDKPGTTVWPSDHLGVVTTIAKMSNGHGKGLQKNGTPAGCCASPGEPEGSKKGTDKPCK